LVDCDFYFFVEGAAGGGAREFEKSCFCFPKARRQQCLTYLSVLLHSHDDDDDEQKKTKQACDRRAPKHAADGVPAQRVADDQRGFERAKVSTGKEYGKRSSGERAQHCWTTAPPQNSFSLSQTLASATKPNTTQLVASLPCLPFGPLGIRRRRLSDPQALLRSPCRRSGLGPRLGL